MNRARLRLGRHSRIGQSYILTTVTQERRRYFDDATAAQEVMDVLRRIDDDGLTHSLAYVVMPDHIHWLVEIRAFSLDYIMQRSNRAVHCGSTACWVRQDHFGNRAITITPCVLKNHCFAMRCTSSPTRSGRTWRAAWESIRMPGADGRSMGGAKQWITPKRRDSADQRSAPTNTRADQRLASTHRCFPAEAMAQRFCANIHSHIAGSA